MQKFDKPGSRKKPNMQRSAADIDPRGTPLFRSGPPPFEHSP
ncbi:hypothetical protein PCL1606_38560 [Pseudomonas chlororaphis]|uniref:Uncharacterized protein n=1 Tax=Pseudomonas chlororaphis TaxID=587753 RepID=A0A0D5Y2T5_9PSED|nr:hypothetical protein PCL1606_38560 [Pseudomonas chlororaphis]